MLMPCQLLMSGYWAAYKALMCVGTVLEGQGGALGIIIRERSSSRGLKTIQQQNMQIVTSSLHRMPAVLSIAYTLVHVPILSANQKGKQCG